MTYNDIIALTQAGFTKQDIIALSSTVNQIQNTLPPVIPPQNVNPMVQPIQQAQQAQQVQPTHQPQLVQPAQQVQQVQPTQQTSINENDVLSIIQRMNVANQSIDIPPARTSNDILADRFRAMYEGGDKTIQNTQGGK